MKILELIKAAHYIPIIREFSERWSVVQTSLNINDLIERAQSKSLDEKYWKDLKKDMKQFLSEDHPEHEKGIIAPLGLLGSVSMIAAGLEYDRLHGKN